MVKEILDEHQVLLETLLPSEWTWGCELEFIMDNELYENIIGDSYYPGDEDNDYDDGDPVAYGSTNDYMIDTLNECMPAKIKFNYKDSKMQGDGSVHPNNALDVPLEWASPIFKAKPEYFQSFVKFLSKILDEGCSTNDSCGFHHHLMFNGMTERDAIWIYCNLAMDTEFLNKSKDFEGFLFDSHWASDSVFKTIKTAIENDNFNRVLEELNTDKYRYIRIHPQGTLEWRGPRDFLNTGDIEIIKDFYYKHLSNVIRQFIEYNKSKTLFGTNLSKDEFFNKLSEARKNDLSHNESDYGTNEFIKKSGFYGLYNNKNRDYKNEYFDTSALWNKINKKPIILTKLIEQNSNILYILFLNMGWNSWEILYKTLKTIKQDNLSRLSYDEISKIVLKSLIRAGQSYPIIFSKLNDALSIDIDENLYNEIIDPSKFRDKSSYFSIAGAFLKSPHGSLGKIEKYIFDDKGDILRFSEITKDFLEIISEKYNIDTALRFCFFIARILYQFYIPRTTNVRQTLENINHFVYTNGTSDFQNKWNQNMISASLNRESYFMKLVTSLDPKTYLRIVSEKPKLKDDISSTIKNNLTPYALQISGHLGQGE